MANFLDSLSSIDSGKVREAANEISILNGRLETELNNCKAVVDALSTSWIGTAADDSISTFDEFINKYNESYRTMINNYVNYLKGTVAETAEKVETANIEASGFLS